MKSIHFATVLVGSALVLGGCQPAADQPEVVRPVLSTVTINSETASTLFAGVINSRQERNLAFQVFGRVTARLVDVGDTVAQGQVMATLDATLLDLAVRSAQADRSAAQSELANLVGAEARQRTLLERKVISASAFEVAQQARQAAEAALARTNSSLIKANEQFGHAILRASGPGVVTSVLADVGQTVGVGQTVATTADVADRDAVVDIPESMVAQIAIGQAYTVFKQSNPQVTAQGIVRQIAPAADTATRTRRIRLGLAQDAQDFRLGSTISVDLSPEKQFEILLPKSAVLTEGDANFVWIVGRDSQQVTRRPVEVSARDSSRVVVVSGLAEGETVVTAGVHSLQNDQNVRIQEATK